MRSTPPEYIHKSRDVDDDCKSILAHSMLHMEFDAFFWSIFMNEMNKITSAQTLLSHFLQTKVDFFYESIFMSVMIQM